MIKRLARLLDDVLNDTDQADRYETLMKWMTDPADINGKVPDVIVYRVKWPVLKADRPVAPGPLWPVTFSEIG